MKRETYFRDNTNATVTRERAAQMTPSTHFFVLARRRLVRLSVGRLRLICLALPRLRLGRGRVRLVRLRMVRSHRTPPSAARPDRLELQ